MVELSKERGDAIIYMETGSGKTRIAVERILASQPQLAAANKMAAFLAPTLPLVQQQACVLSEAGLRVVVYTGQDNKEARSRAEWRQLHAHFDVLVSTPNALNKLLMHTYLTVPQFGLMVLDECHHARKDHAYAILMREFVNRRAAVPTGTAAAAFTGGRCTTASYPERPAILGLTASPHEPRELMALLGASLITPSARDEMEQYMARPQVHVVRVHTSPPSDALATAVRALSRVAEVVVSATKLSMVRDMAFRRRGLLAEGDRVLHTHDDDDDDDDDDDVDTDYGDVEEAAAAAGTGSKQLTHLARQLRAARDTLRDLGPWAALGLACEDLFGPCASASEQLLLQLLERSAGGVRERQATGGHRRRLPGGLRFSDEEGPIAVTSGSSREAEEEEAEEEEEEAEEEEEGGGDWDVGWEIPDWEVAELLDEGDLGDEEQPVDDGRCRSAAEAGLQELLRFWLPKYSAWLPSDVVMPFLSAMPNAMGLITADQPGEQASVGSSGGERGPSLEAQVAAAALLTAAVVLAAVVVKSCRNPETAMPGACSALRALSGRLHTGRRHPLSVRDGGHLRPLAEGLLGLASSEELQQQVLQSGPLVTPALQKLITTLLAQQAEHDATRKSRGTAEPEWAGMVFCSRRATCLALQRVITRLPVTRGQLSSAVFLGITDGMSATSLTMSSKKQERVRRDFREGRLNLLLSTDVGSEGLDFRLTRLVVGLDPPTHVTPFVQCRGRARAREGQYLLLATSDQQQEQIRKLESQEHAMVAAVQHRSRTTGDRRPTNQSPAPDDDCIRYLVEKTGAMAVGSMAPSVLESYCWQLPGSDIDNMLQPYYSYRSHLADNSCHEFQVTIHLPSNCPMLKVVGPWQLGKDRARQAACVQAIRLLHEARALNDYLMPTFTRRGRMRDAQEQDSLQHGVASRVTLTHRLPRALRPPQPRVAAATAAAAEADAAVAPTMTAVAATAAAPAVPTAPAPDGAQAAAGAGGAHSPGCLPSPSPSPSHPAAGDVGRSYTYTGAATRPQREAAPGREPSENTVEHVPPAPEHIPQARPRGGGLSYIEPGYLQTQSTGRLVPEASAHTDTFTMHLYGFRFDPVGSEAAPTAAHGGGAASGALLHPFGLLLHNRLPYDMPSFTVYLPASYVCRKGEPWTSARDIAHNPQQEHHGTPCSAAVHYLGALDLSLAQWTALRAADHVLTEMLRSKGSAGNLDATATPTSAAADTTTTATATATAAAAANPSPAAAAVRLAAAASMAAQPGPTETSGTMAAGGLDFPRGLTAAPLVGLRAWSVRHGVQALRSALRQCGADAPVQPNAAPGMGAAEVAGAAEVEGAAEAALLQDADKWAVAPASVTSMTSAPTSVAKAPETAAAREGKEREEEAPAPADPGEGPATPPAWWTLVPLVEQAAGAGDSAAPADAAAAAAADRLVDWLALERLGRGPKPLQELFPSWLPPLRPQAGQCDPVANPAPLQPLPPEGGDVVFAGGPDGAWASQVRGCSCGERRDIAAATAGPPPDGDCPSSAVPFTFSAWYDELEAALLAQGGGLVVVQTTGGMHQVLGLERHLRPDSEAPTWRRGRRAGGQGGGHWHGVGGGKEGGESEGEYGEVETYGSRLAKRWLVDPASIQPDQPLVRVTRGSTTATVSNALVHSRDSGPAAAAAARGDATPCGQEEEGERKDVLVSSDSDSDSVSSGVSSGGFKGGGFTGGGSSYLLMLPQALAVAPLTLRQWGALRLTPSLVHRMEALVAAAEAYREVLLPVGFMGQAHRQPQHPISERAGSAAPSVATSGSAASASASASSAASMSASASSTFTGAASLVLAALTTRAASDAEFDCERLEFLGDAVLKYLATLYVYGTERNVPVSHEGVMSYKRDQLVANEALARHAAHLGLQHYMRAMPYDMGHVLSVRSTVMGAGTVLAPSGAAAAAASSDALARTVAEPDGDNSEGGKESEERGNSEESLEWICTDRAKEVGGKRLADCVEALVGCHLAGDPLAPFEPPGPVVQLYDAHANGCSNGPGVHAALPTGSSRQDAIQMILRMGGQALTVRNADLAVQLQDTLRFCVGAGLLPATAPDVIAALHRDNSSTARASGSRPATTTAATAGDAFTAAGGTRVWRLGGRHKRVVRAAEAATGYTFRDPRLAVRAMTHVSWPSGEAGGNYQLLEFLGDAVLGLAVSLWVFRYGGSPKDMTERRAALVCNNYLASCCVAAGLHRALRARQRQLAVAVAEYISATAASGQEHAVHAGSNILCDNRVADASDIMYDNDLPGTSSESATMAVPTRGMAVVGGAEYCAGSTQRSSCGGDSEVGKSGDGNALAGGSSDGVNTSRALCRPAVAAAAAASGGSNGDGGSCDDGNSGGGVRAPKVLADVVEALVGAVYQDSEGDLRACEQVVHNLLTAPWTDTAAARGRRFVAARSGTPGGAHVAASLGATTTTATAATAVTTTTVTIATTATVITARQVQLAPPMLGSRLGARPPRPALWLGLRAPRIWL